MKSVLLSVLLFTAILAACSSTNNLAKYNVDESTIYFEEIVTSDARNVRVEYETPDQNDDDKDKKSENIAAEIIKGIGESILSSDVERKLINATNPDSVVLAVSYGIENALVKYLRIKPVFKLTEDSEFFVTTTLDECKLVSQPEGMYIRVRSTCQITDRATGGIVWENSEAENVQLKWSGGGSSGSEVADIINTAVRGIDMATLTEAQISEAVSNAANSVGRLMAETLREDIIESRKQKSKKKAS